MAWRKLTQQHWGAICVHLPQPKASPRGGRPCVEERRWFEGFLWILWTGARWSELPCRYGSPSTCWRRLKEWEEPGVLLTLWWAFLGQLNDQQKLRWDECFADGSFIPAKKGEPKSAKRNAARAQSGWLWSMVRVLCWEQSLDAASPAEVTLLETTLEPVAAGRPRKLGCPCKRPERLIADRGYDSNPLRARLARRGIDPIIPARSNHRRPPLKMAASCDAIGGGGSLNAPSRGWGIFGASSCAMSDCSPPMRDSSMWPVPPSPYGGL